jgi:putative glutamine amidotransferase
MPCKPIIGINCDYRGAKKDAPAFAFVMNGYFDAINRAGGIPILLPPSACEEDLHCILDRIDGVLLNGGADLDSRHDGYRLHPSTKLLEPRRERFDRVFARLIYERKMPVLAIGVGMQLLNVTLGGNLFLHIPEDLPNAISHRDPQDAAHRHGLKIRPGSLMDRVYGDGEIRVNSRHHMAIDELASQFLVTARCPDGVIEAIESNSSDWFAVGTQFHPESEAASALDARIFEEFIDGIRLMRGEAVSNAQVEEETEVLEASIRLVA